MARRRNPPRPTAYEKDMIKRHLLGATIVNVSVDQSGMTCLFLRKGTGKIYGAFVLADPEGNGPGHIALSGPGVDGGVGGN